MSLQLLHDPLARLLENPLIAASTVLAAALSVVYWHHSRTTVASNVPKYKGGDPVIGVFRQLLPYIKRNQTFLLFDKLAREMGDIGRVNIMMSDMYIVAEPTLAKEIFNDTELYGRATGIGRVLKCIGENMVIVLEGNPWKKNRKALSSAFTLSHLNATFPKLNTTLSHLFSIWDAHAASSSPVEATRDMSTLALDALGLSILGVDFGLLSSRSPKPSTAAPKVQKNVIQLVDAMMEGIIKRALTPRPLWGLFMRDGFQETVATLRGIVLEVIESKRREMEGRVGAGEGVHQEGGKSGDLLERILESDARNELTDDEVIDNMILMFMAGQDTSANALVVTLYYLAQHPAVLQKLEKEILDAFGADGTPQSTKELEGLRYLDAVIKESLRLFGPAPMVQRRTTRDAVLGGKWVVPKNAELLIMAHTMQTDDTYWPDAGEFKPERWLEDGGVAGKNAAYVPFAAGPFICVGMRFANVEMRLTLTRIIQRYTFTLTPNQTFTPVYTSTLGFKEGVKFDIVLRSGGRRVGMEE